MTGKVFPSIHRALGISYPQDALKQTISFDLKDNLQRNN